LPKVENMRKGEKLFPRTFLLVGGQINQIPPFLPLIQLNFREGGEFVSCGAHHLHWIGHLVMGTTWGGHSTPWVIPWGIRERFKLTRGGLFPHFLSFLS
jgi:hypothetical protein